MIAIDPSRPASCFAAARPRVAELPRRRAERQTTAPLSFAQERIWFWHRSEPGNPAYNLHTATQILGPLDATALQYAVNAVVARQASLRTRFVLAENQPEQVIDAPRPVPIEFRDLASAPAEQSDTRAREVLLAAARRPFDLSQDLMLRVTWIRFSSHRHWLLLVLPHLAADAWSLELLFQEMAEYYNAQVRSQPHNLPELAASYADFAAWERQAITEVRLQAELAFWKQQLAGAATILELPADRPRPPLQTFGGAVESWTIPRGQVERLRQLSQAEGTTVFMTLLAAFQVLLYRYTGQEELVIGTPITGRTREEWEGLVGLFVNTLAVRGSLRGDPPFRALLDRVRTTVLDAFAHQETPFDKVVEAIQPERSSSHSPLVQVMFALQQAPFPSQAFAGLSLSPLSLDAGTSKLDLTWFVAEEGGNLVCHAEYPTDLFDAATIRRLLGHYQTLLQSAVVEPSRPISELALLSAGERRQLLVEWNNTRVEYPGVKVLHELFEQQAQRSPESLAVVCGRQNLTYRDLNRRANQLAHYLRRAGVGPETLVGISLERSLEMVVGLLGILKAGGAYVPLDPAYPAARLRFMLEDAQVPVLLTLQGSANRIEAVAQPRLCLDADWPSIAKESEANPVSGVTEENLAYVIYTSGSTGEPKGAMNSHRGICNRLLWMQDAYRLTPEDRVLQKTPFSFDVSVWEFFWPLLTGARLVLARPQGHQDPSYLVSVVREEQITTIHFVPSMLRTFLEHPQVKDCTSLKRVICSGEALPFDLQERFFSRLACPLYNLYGPTEAAVDVTAWTCRRGSARRMVPIGRPIANLQTFILDTHGEPTPIGAPGELYLGGVGVGRGYLHREKLTAERFVPNPFSQQSGDRLYRTGDRARYLPDGNIEFLGRNDQQVKLRGIRIELGEIEAALARHPAVRQSAAAVREVTTGDQRLVAYYVPDLDRGVTGAELREFLADKLPDFSIPAFFIPLEALPLTPSGKLDRQSLPLPAAGISAARPAHVEPRNPAEEVLARIWCEVLGLKQASVDANFFELGGHSLLLLQVLSRVRTSFGLELPLARVFQAPTIAAMAGMIEAMLMAEIGQLDEEEARRMVHPHGEPDLG